MIWFCNLWSIRKKDEEGGERWHGQNPEPSVQTCLRRRSLDFGNMFLINPGWALDRTCQEALVRATRHDKAKLCRWGSIWRWLETCTVFISANRTHAERLHVPALSPCRTSRNQRAGLQLGITRGSRRKAVWRTHGNAEMFSSNVKTSGSGNNTTSHESVWS